MSNDRFSTRVYDTEEKRMLYQGCDYLGIDNTSIIDFDDGFECIKYIDFGIRFIPMQCTGFLDKNRKLIYEGDIIDDNFIGIGVITLDKESNYLKVIYPKPGLGKWLFDFLDSEKKAIEIIGNIHENPELSETNK